MWHTSKWQFSDTRCSMALWHRKELFSRLNSSVAALTAKVTCKHVRRAKQKNCGKIAENCDKLRKIEGNCEKVRNCGKMRKILDLNPRPPYHTALYNQALHWL